MIAPVIKWLSGMIRKSCVARQRKPGVIESAPRRWQLLAGLMIDEVCLPHAAVALAAAFARSRRECLPGMVDTVDAIMLSNYRLHSSIVKGENYD